MGRTTNTHAECASCCLRHIDWSTAIDKPEPLPRVKHTTANACEVTPRRQHSRVYSARHGLHGARICTGQLKRPQPTHTASRRPSSNSSREHPHLRRCPPRLLQRRAPWQDPKAIQQSSQRTVASDRMPGAHTCCIRQECSALAGPWTDLSRTTREGHPPIG